MESELLQRRLKAERDMAEGKIGLYEYATILRDTWDEMTDKEKKAEGDRIINCNIQEESP